MRSGRVFTEIVGSSMYGAVCARPDRLGEHAVMVQL